MASHTRTHPQTEPPTTHAHRHAHTHTYARTTTTLPAGVAASNGHIKVETKLITLLVHYF